MTTAILILVSLILLIQLRLWWVQSEQDVRLDQLHQTLDGVDYDVRDIHQTTGSQRAPYREMLRDKRLKGL